MKTKNLLTTMALTLTLLLAGKVGWGQLIISQYIETSTGTTPKGIELWNKSGSTIDFSINKLEIKQGTNGGTPSTIYTLNTGTLNNNDVIVIGTEADVSGTGTGFKDFVESNGATFSTFNFSFNGDDALEVWLGGLKQDVFGMPGIDPGTGWSGNSVQTYNQNISIKNGITSGDLDGWTDPSERFETTTTDNTLTGFGLAPAIDTQSPSLVPANFVPTDNATDVAVNTQLTIPFDEKIQVGTGTISVKRVTDDVDAFPPIDVTSGNVVVTDNIATVTLPSDLSNSTEYYVNISTGAFKDLSNNDFAGLSDKTTWTFTTIDAAAPTITVTSPNGGERFFAGDEVTITWTSANMDSETIKCEAYFRDGLTTNWNWIVLASGLPNTGTFNFTIPTDATYGTQYKIRLTGESSGATNESDATFNVIATPSIYDIQSNNTAGASNYDNDIVRIGGIVTAVKTGTSTFNIWIQDGDSAWSGVYVYGIQNTLGTVAQGDSVELVGTVDESYNLTKIKSVSVLNILNSGNTLPAPVEVTVAQAASENYEGVLVKLSNVECTDADAGYGEFTVSDGTNTINVDDLLYKYTPTQGRRYNITGVVDYSYSAFKVLPRSADDIYLYSNDSTLQAFTLGGQDALGLADVNVTDTINDAGATMYVSDFTGFAGITVTPTDSKATFKVTLNGSIVDPTNYATQTLADGDLIVVTVAAEDGTLNFYKVTLTGENRTLTVTAPAGGETYSTGDNLIITWTSSNIANVNIYAVDPGTNEWYGIDSNIDASLGTYTYTIENGDYGNLFIRVADASDTSFYATSAGTITINDILPPSIIDKYPAAGAVDVPIAFTLSIKFDEEVKDGANGDVIVYRASDNTAVKTIAFTDFSYMGDSLTYIISGLEYSTAYYITMPAGFVVDMAGTNGNAQIAANAWTFTTMAQPPMDLFFSEYIEGSSNNKAVEIYNPTSSPVDLSIYSLKKGTNGVDFSTLFNLSGTLNPGETYVISHSSANQKILDLADTIDAGGKIVFFNGDDAVGLFKNDELIDVIGETIGTDPGTGWSVAGIADATADHTLVRKSSITIGNADWASSAGTNANDSEWEVYDKDDFSFIGWHISKSSEKDILSFELTEQTGPATIDAVNHTVTIEVVNGTNVTALIPTIAVSKRASISPASGVAQDFTNPVTYTVTAQDGTTQNWVVTVTVATTLSSQKDIRTFEIPNQLSSTIDANAATVTVVMPYGTDVTNLTPTITVSAAATISPASGVAQDFTNPVTYTVTAQDGTTKAWTVTVTVQSLPLTSIYQIQYTTNANGDSPLVGEQVKTKGCVTAIYEDTTSYNVWIQDSSKAWNGIEVYGIDNGMGLVSIGDTVEFVGTVQENYNLTRINNVTHISVKNSGSSISPLDVTIADALTEAYEGLFVKLSNVECINADAGYGMFEVSDGTNTILIDDDLYKYTPSQGMRYNIVGLAHYSYNERKILPRAASDIEVATTKYNITFNVKRSDGTTAVADATITVTGQGSVTTDANGVATMQLPNGDYSYVVSKTNFNTYNGTFTVADADQTVNITLIQTGITPNPIAKLNAYPNPFSNRIYFNGAEVTRVTITSVIGQVVMDRQVENTESVDVSSLDRGIYLVRFYNSKGESVLRKLVKEE